MNYKMTEEEFNLKYNLYAKELFTIAFGYTKNQQDSEDIIQNVFVKYFIKKRKFKSQNDEKYWLIRVTINECKDMIKSYYRKNVVINNDLLLNIPSCTQNEEKINLYESIDKLPVKYKEVIILYYYDDLSIKEMASILKVSESAVKVRLNRAKKTLKEKMEKCNE